MTLLAPDSVGESAAAVKEMLPPIVPSPDLQHTSTKARIP
eukprot:CAMPEP_0115428496 /NCGR_PEP_ID=MMETSP0271-20121206/30010_1 /TAXON_ID=71861 /ORGANISM="Scrippsiella trochoidea, Strain CCMP3099" /LENGTH=39 /DNA_ID= /DNA_START= /DNA_END= /DNA_ORIENTATION=